MFFINTLSRISLLHQLQSEGPASYKLSSERLSDEIKNDSFIGRKELYTLHNFNNPSICA
jgi:hypothetical protein